VVPFGCFCRPFGRGRDIRPDPRGGMRRSSPLTFDQTAPMEIGTVPAACRKPAAAKRLDISYQPRQQLPQPLQPAQVLRAVVGTSRNGFK
jgi:hypothetical protein